MATVKAAKIIVEVNGMDRKDCEKIFCKHNDGFGVCQHNLFERCMQFHNLFLEETPNRDNINNPAHYTHGKYETWDIIADWKLDYFLGNAVKYISRAGKKDPNKEIEDLKKAVANLNKKIEVLEND